ncbi:MAG: hypothetical protein E7214_03080 [Clostridium sp.]|nr:hypothetical protein [Clostridium sp.]
MIQIFCNKRGSGKTKKLINLANDKLTISRGDSVYIDDDASYIMQINRKIRFIAANDFKLGNYDGIYGLLCGVISGNYDIENIYIDGIFDFEGNNIEESEGCLKKINDLATTFKINIYINVNYNKDEVPNFIKRFVA